jgi:hypothetical protein
MDRTAALRDDPQSNMTWRKVVPAEGARKLGLVIAGAIALAACGRTNLGVPGRDSGTVRPDGRAAAEVSADGRPSEVDGGADLAPPDAGSDARFGRESAGPDSAAPNQDTPPDAGSDARFGRESAGPETTAPNQDAPPDAGSDARFGRESAGPDSAAPKQDAGPDAPDLGGDGARLDVATVDKDARRDGSSVERDTVADGARPDAAADSGESPACRGTLALGGFLPMLNTGAVPASVVVGDLDGDGRLDLVTANVRASTASVFLGRGDGTFAARTDFGFGYSTYVDRWSEAGSSALALADINGDGKLDLAAAVDIDDAFNSSGLVSVLLGKGDGTFSDPVDYFAGSSPCSVALGDVNGDGRTDVVAANYGSNAVSAWFGINPSTGMGEMGAWCATADGPGTVLLGDLDGDGKLDYLTVNVLAASVSVLLGRGDGTCAVRLDSPDGRDPESQSWSSSAALGDVNADGKLDLVLATSSPSTVTVLLGNGDGSFAAPVDYPTGDGPVLGALRDLNGDGELDLLVAASAAGTVGVLFGRGDGTFAAKVDYPGVQSVRAAALADLDGDGNLDLAMAGPIFAYDGWASVLFGAGSGTFVSRPAYPTGVDLSAVGLADLNRDHKLDLVAVGSQSDGGGTASVLFGTGDGSFAARADYAVGEHPSSFALADVSGDGKLDMVTANQEASSVSVLLGAGDGTLVERTDYPTGNRLSSVAVADLNHDGRADIIGVGLGTAPPKYDYSPNLLLGTGGGKFAAYVDCSADLNGAAGSLAVGDLDGDGQVDLVVTAGGVKILRGKGDERFEQEWPALAPGNSVVLADLNGDGSLDIVATSFEADHTSGDLYGQGQVAVSLGKGDGSFATRIYRTGFGAKSLALGDLDRDGKIDIVTANISSYRADVPNTVSVLYGRGDGTFAPGVDFPAAAVSLAVGDLDGDGRPDLATATPSQSLEALLSSCR